MQNGGHRRRVHVAVPYPRNEAKLYNHDQSGNNHGRAKAGDQKWQCVPDAADSSHQAAHQAARPRMTAAGETTVVGESLGKTHADARAQGCSETDFERVKTALSGERGGEYGRERGDGAVHESGQAGLHDLQYKQAPIGLVLAVLDVGLQLGLFELFGAVFVRAFFLRQVVQQLAHAGVVRAGSGLFVKPAALHFHGAGLIADGVETEGLHQPDRIAMDEATHVLPSD